MHVNQIDTSTYTHIHWAFANLTADFKPDVSGLQEEFDMFKKMTGVKKIISFGGWAFSTEAGTWPIFKNAVKPANRDTFKNNVVAFVNDNGLDGADFDWEYPAVSPSLTTARAWVRARQRSSSTSDFRTKIGS